ncbi:MAG: hypothetical protein ACKPCM_08200, partial [Pseudanabaena sp.]
LHLKTLLGLFFKSQKCWHTFVIWYNYQLQRFALKPHSQMICRLGTYQSMVTGLEVGINPTVCLDDDNEPQTDAVIDISQEFVGLWLDVNAILSSSSQDCADWAIALFLRV